MPAANRWHQWQTGTAEIVVTLATDFTTVPADLMLMTADFSTSESGDFDRLPDKLRPTLELIERPSSADDAIALVQYVAAFVHPDMVCNLAMMEALPPDARQAALDFFEHCMTVGLSIEDQSILLRFIQPYIMATLRGPMPH